MCRPHSRIYFPRNQLHANTHSPEPLLKASEVCCKSCSSLAPSLSTADRPPWDWSSSPSLLPVSLRALLERSTKDSYMLVSSRSRGNSFFFSPVFTTPGRLFLFLTQSADISSRSSLVSVYSFNVQCFASLTSFFQIIPKYR